MREGAGSVRDAGRDMSDGESIWVDFLFRYYGWWIGIAVWLLDLASR